MKIPGESRKQPLDQKQSALHGVMRDPWGKCVCPHCQSGHKQRKPAAKPVSPYLEDQRKHLVVSPSRPRTVPVQVVPRKRIPIASPYNSVREVRDIRAMKISRDQLQAERRHRDIMLRQIEVGAAEMGVDVRTYATLMLMQHRDITPEDYDVLKVLDEKEGLVSGVAPTILSQDQLDKLIPAWVVPNMEARDVIEPRRDLPSRDCDEVQKDAAGVATTPTAADHSANGECECAECTTPGVDFDWQEINCSVCFESFSTGEIARTLPCGHHFHAQCIDPWLTSRSRKCPVDSKPVEPDEADEEKPDEVKS